MAYPRVQMRFYSPLEGSSTWRSIVEGVNDGVVSVVTHSQEGNDFLVSDTIDQVITDAPALAEDLGWETP